MRIAAPFAVTLALSLVGISLPAHASLFDFEDQTPTFTSPPNTSRPGSLPSLTMVKDGLQVTIFRNNTAFFDLVSNTGSQGNKPASYQSVSLDPFLNLSGFFIATFSEAVTSISIDMGDYNGTAASPGDIDNLFLTAFSGVGGTGTQLAQATGTNDNAVLTAGFTSQTLVVSATGIRSIAFGGGSTAFPNSVFYDNLNVTIAAPEPSSLAFVLSVIGTAGMVLRKRRK
ncbi:MAG: PEP-CTERM sorting domain-containing protein [Armatimonadota bacterium]